MTTPFTIGQRVRLGARELRVFEVLVLPASTWVGAFDGSVEPGHAKDRPRHFTFWRRAEEYERV